MEVNHGTAMRAQETAALVDETLSFFVKATDREEASMRLKFTGIKLENLRRERDRCRKHAEERQRFQDKKEEAWSSSRRYHVSGLHQGASKAGPEGRTQTGSPGKRRGGNENGARGRQLPMPSHMAQDTRATRYATTSEINPVTKNVRLGVQLNIIGHLNHPFSSLWTTFQLSSWCCSTLDIGEALLVASVLFVMQVVCTWTMASRSRASASVSTGIHRVEWTCCVPT